jgi:hypothetical protein
VPAQGQADATKSRLTLTDIDVKPPPTVRFPFLVDADFRHLIDSRRYA